VKENVLMTLLSGSKFVFQHVGKTPLIPISAESVKGARLFAKLEWWNPFGSVKDRIAYYMIIRAERRGELTPGQKIIVEPTSGNTGIALAGIGSSLGYRIVTIVPEKVSDGTKAVLRRLGAEVLETPDDLCPRVGAGTDQCISLARALVASNDVRKKKGLQEYFMPNQYANPDNFLAHYETTGPEIWHQTQGEITHLVCGIGTGGTITGAGLFLKEKKPSVQVVAVEPERGHHIQGLRNLEESATPEVLEARRNVIDRWVKVSDDEAFEAVRRLALEERLYAGPSSGAVMHAATELAKNEPGRYVMIFGDSGIKYGTVYEEFGIFSCNQTEKIIKEARWMNPTLYTDDASQLTEQEITIRG
jgi:cysteine synthase B